MGNSGLFRGFVTLVVTGALLSACATKTVSKPGLTREVRQTAAELRERALGGSGAWAIVESLTTEVGPRLAGSAGDRAAVAWAVEKFKQLGFDRVYTEAVSFPTWKRGGQRASVISPFPQSLVVTALGNSVGGSVTAELAHFATLDALKAADTTQVDGKIAFVSNRMERRHDGGGYGPAVAARTSGATEAARKGAVALLIRSIGTDSDRLAHTGVMRYGEDAAKIPAAALSNPDADLLVNMLRREVPVTVSLELGASSAEEFTSYNVVGEFTGSSVPEEVVLLGAHLDSWDLGTGAIDDGAGVAITMAAATLVGELEQRPRRTLRVVLFANEESGLLGAKAYAEKHAEELPNIVVSMESDFGAGPIWRFDYRSVPSALPVVERIASLLAPLGIEMGHDQSRGGPDLIPLSRRGSATFSLRQNGEDYFDWHHTANDTLDKIDPQALDQNVAAYAAAAYAVLESPVDFGFGLELAAPSDAQVIYLVRHAEKERGVGDNPNLTMAGKKRAQHLVELLADKEVTAVYATAFRRTMQTAMPIGKARGLSVIAYPPKQYEKVAAALKTQCRVCLVVGHSNTTPDLVTALGGYAGTPIADDEYDRLYELVISASGSVTTRIMDMD